MNLPRSLADSRPTWRPARSRPHTQALGTRCLLRKAPVRPDRAGDLGKGPIDQFGDQQARVVYRPRHFYAALRNHLEPDAAVIGFVAYQQHQAMAFRFRILERTDAKAKGQDRKSTRLNSSHSSISYVVFCLKKKKHTKKLHSTF